MMLHELSRLTLDASNNKVNLLRLLVPFRDHEHESARHCSYVWLCSA